MRVSADSLGEVPGEALALAEQLIKQLTQSISATDPEASTDSNLTAILEVKVNGKLYFLVCSQPIKARLAPREWDVVRLVIKGYSNSAIAKGLGISPHTVHTHMQRIFDKLEVTSRGAIIAQLSAYDLRGGG